MKKLSHSEVIKQINKKKVDAKNFKNLIVGIYEFDLDQLDSNLFIENVIFAKGSEIIYKQGTIRKYGIKFKNCKFLDKCRIEIPYTVFEHCVFEHQCILNDKHIYRCCSFPGYVSIGSENKFYSTKGRIFAFIGKNNLFMDLSDDENNTIQFSNCNIQDGNRIKAIESPLIMKNCNISGDTSIKCDSFHSSYIADTTFRGTTNIYGHITIEKCRFVDTNYFHGNTHFSETQFSSTTDFSGLEFNKEVFKNCKICDFNITGKVVHSVNIKLRKSINISRNTFCNMEQFLNIINEEKYSYDMYQLSGIRTHYGIFFTLKLNSLYNPTIIGFACTSEITNQFNIDLRDDAILSGIRIIKKLSEIEMVYDYKQRIEEGRELTII